MIIGIMILMVVVINLGILGANLLISRFSKTMTKKIAFNNFYIGVGAGCVIFVPLGMLLASMFGVV